MEETNLQRLIKIRNITTSLMAKLLGITDAAALRKVQRKYQFKLSEAMTLHRELFPEYRLEYLFEGYDELEDFKSEEPEDTDTLPFPELV